MITPHTEALTDFITALYYPLLTVCKDNPLLGTGWLGEITFSPYKTKLTCSWLI